MYSVAVERVSEGLFVTFEYLFLLDSISFIGPNVTRNRQTYSAILASSANLVKDNMKSSMQMKILQGVCKKLISLCRA